MKSKINRGEDPKDSPNSGKGINAIPESSHRTSASTFAIVGIGASAGGLQALEDFLKRVPSDSGLAFGVILDQKIARDEGTLLYPFWQDLAAMLNDPNNFFRSIAIQILTSLCPIDHGNKFESITDDYFAHLHSGSIMTIRYLIQSTSAIFLAKSSLRPYLTNILLHIEKQVN